VKTTIHWGYVMWLILSEDPKKCWSVVHINICVIPHISSSHVSITHCTIVLQSQWRHEYIYIFAFSWPLQEHPYHSQPKVSDHYLVAEFTATPAITTWYPFGAEIKIFLTTTTALQRPQKTVKCQQLLPLSWQEPIIIPKPWKEIRLWPKAWQLRLFLLRRTC